MHIFLFLLYFFKIFSKPAVPQKQGGRYPGALDTQGLNGQ